MMPYDKNKNKKKLQYYGGDLSYGTLAKLVSKKQKSFDRLNCKL